MYCGNNPISRADDGGELWNLIIGAVVGGLISGISTYIQTGDINQSLIAGAVGAANGLIAATGLGMLAQAGLSAVVAGVGDVATQVICENKSLAKVDWGRSAKNAAVAGGCSLVGSSLGKITSYKYAEAGKALQSKGQDKMLTAYVKESVGQSHSHLLRQGKDLFAAGTKAINTARGISSVTGSILTWGIDNKYSA